MREVFRSLSETLVKSGLDPKLRTIRTVWHLVAVKKMTILTALDHIDKHGIPTVDYDTKIDGIEGAAANSSAIDAKIFMDKITTN